VRIAGYTYKAAQYCPNCIVDKVLNSMGLEGHGLSYDTEEALERLAISEGIERYDEHTFDSDDFPKVIFSDWIEPDQHCSACGEELR
jgi:hypothetical protein